MGTKVRFGTKRRCARLWPAELVPYLESSDWREIYYSAGDLLLSCLPSVLFPEGKGAEECRLLPVFTFVPPSSKKDKTSLCFEGKIP